MYGPCSPVEDEIEYCKAHGIDLPFDAKHSYSRDRNLWHISMKGWSWKILHVSQTTMTFLFLVFLLKKHRMKENMSLWTFEAGVPKSLKRKRNESI